MPTRQLFANNRHWAADKLAADPNFFSRLIHQQKPRYLWIGCADSRVPANEIVGLDPGEVFVHRNVANLVIPSDLNCLSVIQYAVDVLGVTDIIVCGHYRCGGVTAALNPPGRGLVENWLGHIRDLRRQHAQELDAIPSPDQRAARLCELNAIAQALNVCSSTVVLRAWDEARPLCVHAWIYDVSDGLLHNLGLTIDSLEVLHSHLSP
jgi:carbonic anhydrase